MKLRVAAIQMTSTADVGKNLRTVASLVADAQRSGAKFVGLPENFAFMGEETDKFAIAESFDPADPGPICSALSQLASTHGMWLLAGGMPERTADPHRVYNTALLFDDEGRIAARYRKFHLFDANLADGSVFAESTTVAAGCELAVANTPWLQVGLSICYDLRFPELFRQLTQQGARLLCVPSAFAPHTGQSHWHVLLRARAIENLCFVLAPAQFGRHSEQRSTYGHAVLVDPWGNVLAEAPDRECAVFADLDLDAQQRWRQQLPCLGHRRLV